MDKVIEILLTNMSRGEMVAALRSMGQQWPVGTLEAINAAMAGGHPSDDCVAEARELMREGRKVAAVRVIRHDTGWSIREALDYVKNAL